MPEESRDLIALSRSLKPEKAPEPTSTVQVYDKTTGLTSWVPPEEAQARFQAGEVNLSGVKPISVSTPDGAVSTVDPGHISDVLAKGASLISDEDRHAEELRQEYSGGKGMAVAGGAGLARGLSLGVSDAALPDTWKEAVQTSNELHPFARTVGEVGGMALGAAAVPGAGLGALAEEGGAGLLARATSGAVTKTATGLGARALARGVALGARGGIEGAEFGLMNTLSEQALSQQPADLTGEKIVAGMGTGALYGALGGAVIGAGTETLATGIREGSKRLAPYLEKQADQAMWRDINSGISLTKQAMKRVKGGTETLGRVARDVGLDDPWLSVEEQFAKAAEAKEGVGKEIGDLYRQSGAMGNPKDLMGRLDEMIDEVRKDAGRENVVAGLEKYRDSLREKLYASARGVEAAAATPQEISLEAAERDMVAKGASESELADIRKIRETLREARLNATKEEMGAAINEHRLPLADLWEQRRALGRLVYDESRVLDAKGKTDVLRQFYGTFGDYLADTGEEAARAAGKEFAAPLRALNSKFQALSLIHDSLETKVARGLTNRVFSLTDTIAGSAGGSAGIGAIVAGHPLAGAVSLAAGPLHRFVRERGQRLAAYALGHVGGLEAVSAHVAQVDTAIERAVTDYVERGTPRISGIFPTHQEALPEVAREERTEEKMEDRFASRAGAVRELAQHPDLGGAADQHLSAIAKDAPDAAREASSTIQRAVSYLSKELPPAAHLDPLRPGLETPPSRSEMARWLRKERAVDEPLTVIHDLRAGRLDPDTIAAAREVYPKIYADVQKRVLMQMQETARPISRQERLQLGEAFGIATTPALAPDGIARRQQAYVAAQKDQAGPASRRRSGKLSQAFGLASASESLERGEE